MTSFTLIIVDMIMLQNRPEFFDCTILSKKISKVNATCFNDTNDLNVCLIDENLHASDIGYDV